MGWIIRCGISSVRSRTLTAPFSRLVFTAAILASGIFVAGSANAKIYSVKPGLKYLVGQLVGWDARCRSTGYAKVIILKPPKYGKISVRKGGKYVIPKQVTFGKAGKCVGKRIRGVGLYYRANPGFRGTDKIVYKARAANSKTFYTFTDTYRVK